MIALFAKENLEIAERIAESGDINKIYRELGRLPFAECCLLDGNVPATYPNLQRKLPTLPSKDVQIKWCGDSGESLLRKSANVVRLIQILCYNLNRAEGSH